MEDGADAEAALEAQQMLLESSLEVAFRAYDDALSENIRDPVVFLLDCEDSVGGEIARSWLGDDAVDEAIAAQEMKSTSPAPFFTTVYACAFPFLKCRTEVPAVFAYLAPVFAGDAPTDGFLAIAVTSGGASALTVPFAARD